MPRFDRSIVVRVLTLLIIAAWVFWLRWPTFSHVFWNLDEGIYATVGRTVLEGGVMYRDAIDHRSPFCHYLTAAIFAVAGVNNAWAMHAALAAMVSLLAFALFLLGRRWRNPATGWWAAAITAALSVDFIYPGDAFSLGTEWVLAGFSAWGAWLFWRSWRDGHLWGCFAAGAAYAAAFMSKQPGLLEVGAPIFLLAYAAATGRLAGALIWRNLIGLVGGYAALLALVFGYFWANGTLDDFYFYGWAYNLVYYGAEVTPAERLEALAALPRMLGEPYPLLLLLAGLAVVRLLHLVARDQPPPGEREAQPAGIFLLAWLALSAAGSAAAGRVHPHYYLQALPPLVLCLAWLLGSVTKYALQPGIWWRRASAAVLAVIVAWNVLSHPVQTRADLPFGRDPGWIPADYIRERTRPDERIFVWGLYPDFYVFADRRPASKYIYTSFQTGVQPGRNTAPGVKTEDDAVQGSLTALCQELEATRPVYFVDSSLGAQRLYEKYPLANFPRLEKFVAENYVEVDPAIFRPHGFRVLLIKDAARPGAKPEPEPTGAGQPDAPLVFAPLYVNVLPAEVDVLATDAAGGLQRLEMLVNNTIVDAITFPATGSIRARFRLPFDRIGPGRHAVSARAISRGGRVQVGSVAQVDYSPELVPRERLKDFALPIISSGTPPERLVAPSGAISGMEEGARVFTANAPSAITYVLSPRGALLTGKFGIREGAYAPNNPGPTDGAEFVITWTARGQNPVELFRRFLNPGDVRTDRSTQAFQLRLPAGTAEGRLEFIIREGPNGNGASDWTYWSDLSLRLLP